MKNLVLFFGLVSTLSAFAEVKYTIAPKEKINCNDISIPVELKEAFNERNIYPLVRNENQYPIEAATSQMNFKIMSSDTKAIDKMVRSIEKTPYLRVLSDVSLDSPWIGDRPLPIYFKKSFTLISLFVFDKNLQENGRNYPQKPSYNADYEVLSLKIDNEVLGVDKGASIKSKAKARNEAVDHFITNSCY